MEVTQAEIEQGIRFARVLKQIRKWHRDKGILVHSNAHAQAEKALEECGELVGAASAYKVTYTYLNEQAAEQYREEGKDAVGDVLVCLSGVCGLMDLDLVECAEHAYAEIKDRKGQMRADGKFYKEQA